MVYALQQGQLIERFCLFNCLTDSFKKKVVIIMKKILVTFVILVITSFSTQASIIMSIWDDGNDLFMQATGTYDNTGLDFATIGGLGANAAVAGSICCFGWETGSFSSAFNAVYSDAITASESVFPATTVATSNPFIFVPLTNEVVFEQNAPVSGSVDEFASFAGVTVASLGMVAGESTTITWGTNTGMIEILGEVETSQPVPAPHSIALIALGLFGIRKLRK